MNDEKILQPGEILPLSLTGRYLICRRVEGTITIAQPDIGLAETRIKQADIVELNNTRQVFVKNNGDSASTIELQSTNIKIQTNDGGSVSISGGTIDTITNGISVTADATVQDGSVVSQSHDAMGDAPDITVPANSKVLVLAADGTKNKRTFVLQNISATETQLRVGSTSVTAGRGALLKGSIDAIAELEFESVDDVYVYNDTGTDATVSLMYGSR